MFSLPFLRKLRQVRRHRIVQPDLSLLHQLHHRRRRGNALRHRSNIEDRVHGHRLPHRLQRTHPERLAIHHLAVVPHQHHAARNRSPATASRMIWSTLPNAQRRRRSCRARASATGAARALRPAQCRYGAARPAPAAQSPIDHIEASQIDVSLSYSVPFPIVGAMVSMMRNRLRLVLILLVLAGRGNWRVRLRPRSPPTPIPPAPAGPTAPCAKCRWRKRSASSSWSGPRSSS